jgi:hypothetical protein
MYSMASMTPTRKKDTVRAEVALPPGFVYIVGARRLLQVVVDLIERAWSEGDLR